MSTHINFFLLNAAKQLIQTHAAGNQYRFVYEDVVLNQVISMPTRSGIEDTGQRIDPAGYGMVEDYLRQPAGPDYGTSSLHDILMERLREAGEQHGKKSVTAVSEFYAILRYRPIEWLLEGDAADVVAREPKLRRSLKKLGFRLKKARTRNPFDFLYQCYTITHEQTHEVNIDAATNLAGLERWIDKQLGFITARKVIQSGNHDLRAPRT